MHTRTAKHEAGFSMIELIIAMAVTLTIMGQVIRFGPKGN